MQIDIQKMGSRLGLEAREGGRCMYAWFYSEKWTLEGQTLIPTLTSIDRCPCDLNSFYFNSIRVISLHLDSVQICPIRGLIQTSFQVVDEPCWQLLKMLVTRPFSWVDR